MAELGELGEWFLISEDGLKLPRYVHSLSKQLDDPNSSSESEREEKESIYKERWDAIIEKVEKLVPSSPKERNDEINMNDISKSRDYNEAFQNALRDIKKLNPNTRREDRFQAYGDMAHLGEDFLYTVRTYGRIIISEGILGFYILFFLFFFFGYLFEL